MNANLQAWKTRRPRCRCLADKYGQANAGPICYVMSQANGTEVWLTHSQLLKHENILALHGKITDTGISVVRLYA